MEADILKFELDDLKILETFDFEEDIQRPYELRFFTLEQQINDFFEKVIPPKMTRFQEKYFKSLRDRIKVAYEKTIYITETDYYIKSNFELKNIGWIYPVYNEFDYEEYNFKLKWTPLFERDQRKVPNYYSRLIGALPKPYKNKSEGRVSKGTLISKDGKKTIQVLDLFESTKTILNDDGSKKIVKELFTNTDDYIKTIGYYLKERLPIPRPFDHPFLKSNKETFIETDVSLENIYPSIETILEHAIPTTRDPYEEGLKYLKLYGLELYNIPWMAWKSRFFPAEYRDLPIPVKELQFKNDIDEKPSDFLLSNYTPWYSAYDPRYWLSLQYDGGNLVSKCLLSNANLVGSMSMYPYLETITYDYPDSEAEICQGFLKSFESFLESGLYRPIQKSGKCIPITTILQEKIKKLYKDRISWKETTKNDIVKDYVTLSKLYLPSELYTKKETYTKFEGKNDSERRKDVLSILKDTEREPLDKAEALEILMRDLEFKENNYFDLSGSFVMCYHTLEILRGVLEEKIPRFKFYSMWTYLSEGSRICKFCGDIINNDNLVATKEYDLEGHLTMEYTPLTSEIIVVNSLTSLKSLFNNQNSGESIIYILLSYLQIIPTEQQLQPILQKIRIFSKSLKEKSEQSKKISEENRLLTEGIFGIAGFLVLIQTHNPFLIPRRKINSKEFITYGYPRDTDNSDDCPILKSIFSTLKLYLKSLPILGISNISEILRKLITNQSQLENETLRWIQIFYREFKVLFESAKERYVKPEETIYSNTFLLPQKEIIIQEEKSFTKTSIFKTLNSFKFKKQPQQLQTLKLQSKIIPTFFKELSFKPSKLQYIELDTNEITKYINLGLSGFEFQDFIKTADSSSYFFLINQILNSLRNSSFPLKEQIRFRTLITNLSIKNPSLQRDSLKSILFQLLSIIKTNQSYIRLVKTYRKTDLTFKLLFMNEEKAKKEEEILRAAERNKIKQILRYQMDDEQRLQSQILLQLGLSEFLITNKMREEFYEEYTIEKEETELRDYIDNGDIPQREDGIDMEVDYGDYGDRTVRDYDDYTSIQIIDDD